MLDSHCQSSSLMKIPIPATKKKKKRNKAKIKRENILKKQNKK